MDAYTLHLAMAALVGASFVAVSAYHMHRTLTQLLDFAKTYAAEKRRNHGRRKASAAYNRRGSASMSDVTAIADGVERSNGPIPVEPIPVGLPQLHTLSEGLLRFSHADKKLHRTEDDDIILGKSGGIGNSAKRAGHSIRPTSPKSPVASASAFESVEGSDDEDNMMDSAKLDASYLRTNGDAIPPDNLNVNGKQLPMAASSIICSHSVSGDLHGVQPGPVAADILRKEPEQETFVRLKFAPHEVPSSDEDEVYLLLQECLEMRESYVFREAIAPWEKEVISDPSTPKPDPNPFSFTSEEKTDVIMICLSPAALFSDGRWSCSCLDSTEKLFPVADATTFFTDLHHILRKFNIHLMLNADKEFLAQKMAPHRDFYNVRKVDTHVHHSACMNQKHLLRFIKSKLRKEPDEEMVVIFRDGTYLMLKEVFEALDLTGYDLNVDLLDVHADKSTFHRFDKFNLKYNPCGQSRLREIFLKQDNLIQMAEYRISIYGRKQSLWDQLASWIVNNELYSENVVLLIQEIGIVTSFQNILGNIFLPLFEVTVDPNSHPQLHVFLKQVVGLDFVDDESKPERRPTKHMPTPAQWTNVFNPAYSYYAYYCYANLYTVNKLRESKGMTTIKFRPHSGEAGDINHLAATFLLAHNIAHRINLRKSPHRNPFPLFFPRGLNSSLSTDDPLQIHLTKEPLVEEYSIAASVWKLSSCDLCEIARNSSRWIGKEYYKRGPGGNDIRKTNVPHIRVEFRDAASSCFFLLLSWLSNSKYSWS
ncbi:AMP deaminase [Dillenia turbinata]|uniref:AMP deaminase n=1 Tax=Dillenia turbinata TaxID=194707 RepID=A0AAN8ZN29_9MAGN